MVGGVYQLTVYISGLDPDRAITGAEQLRGWTSINPPTIVAKTVTLAKQEAILCTQAALADTPGVELTADMLSWSAYSVGFSAAGALQEIGVDA